MKDLRPIKGKFYLQRVIAEGEHETQDFKFAISDARKIARSISAFANRGGGQLLIGVKDNGVIAGVRNEEDIYVVEEAAHIHCRPAQQPDFTAFKADDGHIVIRAQIAAAENRPVLARDTDGQWKAYYRVADENILASPLMLKAWARRASAEPIVFQISDTEQQLLHLLQQQAETAEHLMLKLHVSKERIEDMIIRLYALELVDFAFRDRQFTVTLTE